MMQNVSEFFSRKSSIKTELLQPRRAEFKDPELEGAYRQSRLGDHLQQLRVLLIIGVVATVYFIPSDILFYGWGERAKWLLSVRASYILISIACLVYSFRLTADRLTTVALLWFIVTMLSQGIFATNRPQTHMGNFVVELIAILLIYLLLPVTVRRRFYAAGLLTLFGFVVLFFGREQQPQEMVRALAFAAILANFAGIFVSYRHERLDRLKYYLLRSEQAAKAELAEAITSRKKEDAVTQIRLDMIEYATNHSLDELLTWSLDEAGKILNSPIGFYHFVETDQKTLSLQQWSTQTLKNFCRAEGAGHHYSIDMAGVWVDCVKTLGPVVHNDYESLPHKKGLPPGHAQVIREMVVPVIRKGKVVAILGVGNKPVDYTENDVEIISKLADYTWEVIGRKRAELELQSTKDLLARTNQIARIGGWEVDLIQQKICWTDITREIHEVDADYVPDLKTAVQFYKEGESRATIQSLVNRAIETGEGFDVELQIKTARGNELWVHSIGHAEFEGDKVVRLYGTLQDIDTDKKNRLRIQKSEESLRNAQQIAKMGSWELDVETNEVIWTEELYKMYGFDPSKPPPTYIEHMKLFTPESWEALSTSIAKTREHGIPYELELRTIKKDQGNGWMWVRGEAVFDKNNKIIGLQGTAQDITERKKIERLKEEVDRLARHDVRSSLNGIIGIPQILKEQSNLTDKQREYLQMVIDSGHTVLNQVNLSLTIYKIEEGSYEFSGEIFDLQKLCRQCITENRSLIESKNIEVDISTENSDAENPKINNVFGEELLAYSVVSNLVKNAVEASPTRELIKIDITNAETNILFSIHNKGVVPKEIRNTFFNKYTTSGKKGGTGIGTYSAKRLSEAQGWNIEMQTSEENGTSITVTIPRTEEHCP